MTYIGKRLHYKYGSGLEVNGYFKSAAELEWEGLTGPSKGMKGAENICVQEIADRVFFISWLEKSGVTVSQVIDFEKLRVTAFVTFETESGRESLFDQGTISEVQG